MDLPDSAGSASPRDLAGAAPAARHFGRSRFDSGTGDGGCRQASGHTGSGAVAIGPLPINTVLVPTSKEIGLRPGCRTLRCAAPAGMPSSRKLSAHAADAAGRRQAQSARLTAERPTTARPSLVATRESQAVARPGGVIDFRRSAGARWACRPGQVPALDVASPVLPAYFGHGRVRHAPVMSSPSVSSDGPLVVRWYRLGGRGGRPGGWILLAFERALLHRDEMRRIVAISFDHREMHHDELP
jgi:hypothetical protein